jgi:uncharacterized OB-fold protein
VTVQVTGGEELTAPFWEAAARGELVRPVCDACSRSFFTPQAICPHCGSEGWTYVASDGVGAVETYSVVHHGPDPRFDTPYVLAVVELVNEGWRLMTNIVGVAPDQVHIGMPVVPLSIAFEDRTLPGFTAAPAEAGA